MEYSTKIATKRVVSFWLRQAISKSLAEEFSKIPDEELSFGNIFGDKKRIAIPAPRLVNNLKSPIQLSIEGMLSRHGFLKEGDSIDWKTGMVTKENGRKMRLGKLIDRMIAPFKKKYPKVWDAVKEKIRAKRLVEKAKKNVNDYVDLPWRAMQNQLRQEMPTTNIDPKDMLTVIYKAKGIDPKDKHNEIREIGFGDPTSVWAEGAKAWARGMRDLLDNSDEIVSKLQKKAEEDKKTVNDLIEKLQSIDLDSLDEEGRKKYQKTKTKIKRLYDEKEAAKAIEHLLKGWPLKERKNFLKSVDRAMGDLAKAAEGQRKAEENVYDSVGTIPIPNDRDLLQHLSGLEKNRQEYDRWKSKGVEDMSLVISRAPLDVLRMSDHPTAPQAIQSCHSEGHSYFSCAKDEAQGTGLVAYVVPTKDLEKVNLEDDEIFEDRDRGVKGIKPYARVRLRRFENKKDGSELALPELTTYGTNYHGLVDSVTDWARKAQKDIFEKKPRMEDYILTGGKYRDNYDSQLFNNFFDTPDREKGNTDHSKRKKKKPSQDSWGSFWSWMEKSYPEVPNPNREGRKDRISPRTLKEYAQGGQYQQSAMQMIKRYLREYQQQSKKV